MIEASEYIFCDEYAADIDTAKSGRCHIMYRRADLPATDAQALANPKVKALVKAAILDAQLRAWERGRIDTPDEIEAAALAQLKEGQNDE